MQTFFNIWLKFYFRIWMISIEKYFSSSVSDTEFLKREQFFFSWVIINSYYYVNFRCRAWFNICTHNEKWPPQQVQLPSVTMKVSKKIFFLIWWAPRIHSLGNRSEWFLVNAFRMTNAINLDFLNHRYLIMFSYSGN